MKNLKFIMSLVIFGLFLLFAIQNNNSIDIQFLTISLSQIPLFVVLIVVFITGFILGRITEWISSLFMTRIDKKKNKESKK